MRFAVSLCVLVLAGCSSPTAVVDPDSVQVELTSWLIGLIDDSGVSQSISVDGDTGYITVRGGFTLGGGGCEVRAEFGGEPGQYYRLTVIVDGLGGIDVGSRHGYEAVISGLPSGKYPLTVVHVGDYQPGEHKVLFRRDVYVR